MEGFPKEGCLSRLKNKQGQGRALGGGGYCTTKYGATTWPLQWDPWQRRKLCGRGGVSARPPARDLVDVPGRAGGSEEDGDLQTPLGKEPLAVRARPRWGKGRPGKVRRGVGKEILSPPPAFLGWAPSRREGPPFPLLARGCAQQPMPKGLQSLLVGDRAGVGGGVG